MIINKNITGLKHLKKHFNLVKCEAKCSNRSSCDCFYYQKFNNSCSLLNSRDCNKIVKATLPEINGDFTVLIRLKVRDGK